MKRSLDRLWVTICVVVASTIGTGVAQQGQRQSAADGKFKVEITETPSADCGGVERSESIAGRVIGVTPNQYRLLIYAYACNGVLYVQPTVAAPYTNIDSDGNFETFIHLGQTYYILLVEPSFKPKAEMSTPPEKGGGIAAVFKFPGKKR